MRLFIFLFFLTCCSNDTTKTTLNSLMVEGDVKKIVEYEIGSSKDTIQKSVQLFNKQGFIIFSMDSNNYYYQKDKYEYNDRKQLIEEIICSSKSYLNLSIKYHYGIDTIIISAWNNKGKCTANMKRIVNANDKVTREYGNYFIDSDSLFFDTRYYYVDGILQIKDMTRSDAGLDNNKYYYTGNINGFPNQIIVKNKEDELIETQKLEYQFDKKNNWIKKKIKVKSETISTYIRNIEYY